MITKRPQAKPPAKAGGDEDPVNTGLGPIDISFSDAAITDEQRWLGLALLRDLLPSVLAESPEPSSFDREVASKLADSIIANHSRREAAEIAGFAMHRATEARACLFITLEIMRSSGQASSKLLEFYSSLAGTHGAELARLAVDARQRGKLAADARHSRPGGSRAKQQAIRAAWASGRYTSRERCAEEECGALDMSFSAARRALRNTPDPA